jgi:endonuclease/exonuclease/phosphatase family metal-dependent hydrolase
MLSIIILAILVATGLLLIKTLAGHQTSTPPVVTVQQDSQDFKPNNNSTITVLSLNLAHGRRDGSHQISQTTPQIRANLDAVLSMLKREQPDIIGLQEADGPSFWSGRFSHVAYLASSTQMNAVHGIHVEGLGLSYGTALLSNRPLSAPLSVTFKPIPPTLTKGFTVATVHLNSGLEVDIVSVHLDFFSKRTRLKQIKTMVQHLAKRQNPLIIMGDFNGQWREGSAPQVLSRELHLTTYKPTTDSTATFRSLQKRIDFILVSKEFEISDYTVLNDVLSDHQPILAKLKIRGTSKKNHSGVTK